MGLPPLLASDLRWWPDERPGPSPTFLVAEDLRERGVLAAFSTRVGGLSRPPYDSLNLGLSVGDDEATVLANRRRLLAGLGLGGVPLAIVYQVHSPSVALVERRLLVPGPPELGRPVAAADGMVTRDEHLVLSVGAGDCAPVLLVDARARVVGAVHVGWRGLAAGVIETGVAALARAGGDPAAAVALIGPAIGPCCYPVGADVQARVSRCYPAAAATARTGAPALDVPGGAAQALRRAGVGEVRTARHCTYHAPGWFFSYRRDGVTGRQAGLVALLPGG
jgi:YfiH family protein